MDIPLQYIPILGPISAAIIVGIITYVVSVLSKEQKTSEFRQAWIDGLREDISEFTGHSKSAAYSIANRMKLNLTQEEKMKFLFDKEIDAIKLTSLLHRIRLRLNAKEHAVLLGLILESEVLLSKAEDDFEIKYALLVEKIINETQIILKKEWKRVKRGEPVFVFTKWAACLVFILAVVALCFKIYQIK